MRTRSPISTYRRFRNPAARAKIYASVMGVMFPGSVNSVCAGASFTFAAFTRGGVALRAAAAASSSLVVRSRGK